LATRKKNIIKKSKSGSSGKQWIKAFFVALILILLIKSFLVESFIVKSTNMGNTVLPGEILAIGKLDYGARLPVTLLSIPFFGYDYYNDLIELPAKRLPGLDRLKRLDIVLFNAPFELEKPIDKRSLLLSRIIGLPGETIEIVDYKSRVDNQINDITNQNMSFKYSLQVDSEAAFRQLVKKYDLTEGSITKKNTYVITGSQEKINNIKAEEGVNHISFIDDFEDDRELIYATNQIRRWNKKNFGPLYVPAKGDTIKLNKKNIELYIDLIKYHEGNEVTISEIEIQINGLKAIEYSFKNNYYFVLDDNRSDSKDSRYWGFLPETHVIGKSMFVLFPASKNGVKANINRLFKKTI